MHPSRAPTQIYDYVGYGFSTPHVKPSESRCYASIQSAVTHALATHTTPANIVLWGESLGTGIVSDYVASHPAWESPIVLLSPYTSIARVACDSCIVSPVDQFETLHKAGDINCPVLLIHGTADVLIAPSHSEILAKVLKHVLKRVLVEGADHENVLWYITREMVEDVL